MRSTHLSCFKTQRMFPTTIPRGTSEACPCTRASFRERSRAKTCCSKTNSTGIYNVTYHRWVKQTRSCALETRQTCNHLYGHVGVHLLNYSRGKRRPESLVTPTPSRTVDDTSLPATITPGVATSSGAASGSVFETSTVTNFQGMRKKYPSQLGLSKINFFTRHEEGPYHAIGVKID